MPIKYLSPNPEPGFPKTTAIDFRSHNRPAPLVLARLTPLVRLSQDYMEGAQLKSFSHSPVRVRMRDSADVREANFCAP